MIRSLLTLACGLTFFLAEAQDYVPMLQEGNKWSVDVYYNTLPPGCEPNCQYTVTPQIALGAIEMVDGKSYYRIMSDGTPTCLIREENGMVYQYDVDAQLDRVLFDYTLEVGDTFFTAGSAYDISDKCINHDAWPGWEDLTVAAVDFVELAGALRKVITFDQNGYFGNFQWIEGIGNITGFDFMWEAVDFTDGSLLVCFETDGLNYFFNDATSCDNTTLGITDLPSYKSMLHPNPVTATSILQFAAEGLADTVHIFDINGKQVRSIPVLTDYILINAMDYRAGLYFYQVSSEGKILKTKKFIVR